VRDARHLDGVILEHVGGHGLGNRGSSRRPTTTLACDGAPTAWRSRFAYGAAEREGRIVVS
jgi:hypothetical protein